MLIGGRYPPASISFIATSAYEEFSCYDVDAGGERHMLWMHGFVDITGNLRADVLPGETVSGMTGLYRSL